MSQRLKKDLVRVFDWMFGKSIASVQQFQGIELLGVDITVWRMREVICK